MRTCWRASCKDEKERISNGNGRKWEGCTVETPARSSRTHLLGSLLRSDSSHRLYRQITPPRELLRLPPCGPLLRLLHAPACSVHPLQAVRVVRRRLQGDPAGRSRNKPHLNGHLSLGGLSLLDLNLLDVGNNRGLASVITHILCGRSRSARGLVVEMRRRKVEEGRKGQTEQRKGRRGCREVQGRGVNVRLVG